MSELSDPMRVVLNESAIKTLHLHENPVGQTLSMNNRDYTVSGVVKDFNAQGPDVAVNAVGLLKDTLLDNNSANPGCLYAKIVPGANITSLLESVHRVH